MRILILSRRHTIYSTRRLREAALALGHTVQVLDPQRCAIVLHDGHPDVLLNGKPLVPVDVIIPRIGLTAAEFGISLVRHLELMGIASVNPHHAITEAKDKLGCLQQLLKHGIPVPGTLVKRYPRNVEKEVELLGGPPAVLKLLHGTRGAGVILAESFQAITATLEAIWSIGEDILIQKYISETKGVDIRILVVGEEIVAAMKRFPREGDFRSNLHRGGTGEAITLSKQERALAVRAAQAIGLRVAGVDILRSRGGPLVLEVNSSPGLQGLEEVTRMDIAMKIVEYATGLVERGA